LSEDFKLSSEQEKEDGWWDEDFKGQKDNKNFGPTAVALDFTFPGSKAVYGIPEHATSLSLKSTKYLCLFIFYCRLYFLFLVSF